MPVPDRDSWWIAAPGIDEVGVVPWPLLLRDRLARRVEASDRYRWWVLWSALAGLFSVGFTITILAVSLPRIAEELGSDTATLTWVITGPLLAFGVVGPTFGKLGDIWGQKRIYLLGLAGAAVFAALSAVAWDASSLILFRVLGAAEGAAAGPASMALIMKTFPRNDRVKAMGWWSLIGAGAPVLGVVVGGPVVEHLSWRWLFAAQVPFTLVAMAVAVVVLPDSERGPRRSLDLPGVACLSGATTSLLFGLNRGPVWGWTSPVVLGALALSPVLLAFFVRVERRSNDPLIPLAYLRRRNFTFPIAAQAFANFAYMGGFILTPLLLKEGFGFTETRIGLLIIARPLSFSIMAPLSGYAAVRVGERAAAVSGTALVALSMVALASLGPGTATLQVVLALALSGIGLGLASPSISASVANSVDDEHMGIAGAAQQLITQVGLVAGIQLMYTLQQVREPSAGLIGSFGEAYLLGGAVCVLGVVAASRIRSTTRAP